VVLVSAHSVEVPRGHYKAPLRFLLAKQRLLPTAS